MSSFGLNGRPAAYAGQTDWQYGNLRWSEHGTQGDRAENQPAGAADRKQDPRHQGQPTQGADAGNANQQPPGDHQQNPVEVHPVPRSGEQTRRHGRQRPLRHGTSNLLFRPLEQASSESIDRTPEKCSDRRKTRRIDPPSFPYVNQSAILCIPCNIAIIIFLTSNALPWKIAPPA